MKTLVIIGGGAAGIFCAVNAAKFNPDLKIIVLEKSNKLLSKVRISGGGRCNLTHACESIVQMSKCYPRGEKFVKQTFQQFFTTDTINWFTSKNVALKTEKDGRIFPESNNSETIINCLMHEVNKYNIEILLQHGVDTIEKQENFILHLNNNKTIEATYVCVATGGFPKINQFDFLKNVGHTIQKPVPSLFTFKIINNSITQLMGVVAPNAEVKIAGTKLQNFGPLLITHWGLSGPAILKLSAYAAKYLHEVNYNYTVIVNWNKNYNETQILEALRQWRFDFAAQQIGNKNPVEIPNRLWEFILQQSNIETNTKWTDITSKQQNILAKNLTTFALQAKGKTTFKDEFVTAGGITLSEINPQNMESRIVKNLYFAGEIIDVDGITGGYNFQNAWTTGYIVAKNLIF